MQIFKACELRKSPDGAGSGTLNSHGNEKNEMSVLSSY